MDDLLFGIKDQIYQTIVLFCAFFKKVEWAPTLGFIALLYLVGFRRWEFKKTLSFLAVSLLALIAYVRLEAFFASPALSAEGSQMAIAILRITSVVIMACIFLFHAFLKD